MRRIGIVGIVAMLLLPEAAVVVLLGIATSWWLAGLFAGSWLALLIVGYFASRSTGFLGRAFGTADCDPLDYSQWTPRNLFLRPLVSGLPAAIALIAVAFITAHESTFVTVALAVPSALVGFALGGWLWLGIEDRRRRDERAAPDQGSVG